MTHPASRTALLSAGALPVEREHLAVALSADSLTSTLHASGFGHAHPAGSLIPASELAWRRARQVLQRRQAGGRHGWRIQQAGALLAPGAPVARVQGIPDPLEPGVTHRRTLRGLNNLES